MCQLNILHCCHHSCRRDEVKGASGPRRTVSSDLNYYRRMTSKELRMQWRSQRGGIKDQWVDQWRTQLSWLWRHTWEVSA
jgi:hypothetical protein